ncbi:SCO2322 family protein [Streptomyces sp. NPDC048636]|uniref:SCO2322 family protein n=1 Tax=Streptomyces sp. NPDC048636 TaxID=3155762 RepID=UPI003445B434
MRRAPFATVRGDDRAVRATVRSAVRPTGRCTGRGPWRAGAPRRVSAVVAVLTGLLVLVVGAVPAQAGAGYRYWSFWEREAGAKSWTYATQGPSVARPVDGETIGFRFGVSEDSENAVQPRGAADFDTVCADTPAKDGSKRIAVIIDFGTAADAPGGDTPPGKARTRCARVETRASAGEALAAVAEPLRYNSAALLCAIAGYPSSGCGEKTDGKGTSGDGGKGDPGSGAGRSGAEKSDDGGPSAGLIGGIAAVVLLGAAGVWQARRRRV